MGKQLHKTATLRRNAQSYMQAQYEAELARTHTKVPCSHCQNDDWPFDDCPRCCGRGWLLRRNEDLLEFAP